jgi:hypothetical protein
MNYWKLRTKFFLEICLDKTKEIDKRVSMKKIYTHRNAKDGYDIYSTKPFCRFDVRRENCLHNPSLVFSNLSKYFNVSESKILNLMSRDKKNVTVMSVNGRNGTKH